MAALALTVFASLAFGLPSTPVCKTTNTSPFWPSHETWTQLNSSLGGKLLAPLPPAIVCDKTKPQYNADECSSITNVWPTVPFQNQDPVTLHQPNWQNDSCVIPLLPNAPVTCDLAPFAKYVVNASQPEDVVAAVRFAGLHNLRLSVKNTGHDYLGRSTSPDFQLWTHYLTGIEKQEHFKPEGCPGCKSSPAVTVYAGNQYGDIYTFAKEHNILISGGADPSVGVGGHLTGGGHGPFGSVLGLMVDNVLEMTVVIPCGDLVTANEYQNADIFWAMKGGGGSTFGVLVTATLKTHPDLPSVPFNLVFTSVSDGKDNSAGFYDLLASMHAELVGWSDNYVNGYYSWGPLSSLAALDPSASGAGSIPAANVSTAQGPMAMFFGGYGLNQTFEQLNATIWPFAEKLNATRGVTGTLTLSPQVPSSNNVGTNITGPAGFNAGLGSRLWDKRAMLDRDGLLRTFKRLGANVVQGLLVSGPGVRNQEMAATTSVTPAWRRSYAHMIAPTTWAFNNKTSEGIARRLQTELTQALQDHAPDMGAYLNEADVDQPDAPAVFWGDNYERLLQIKRSYDPDGMFWCKPCVGWEDWTLDEGSGQLCRKGL